MSQYLSSIALKHYTSKLSTFEDLTSLQTFGFRGEALSSLCALSELHVTTAQAHQAPRATRLDFEPSGKLNKTQVVAGQRGTTVSVERLFKRLPVRRRDLEKNIKREYGKVLNLLHAYACIGTGVRFSVKNTVGKTKNVVVFATSGNPTTKQNIANVYGAKTLSALIPLDLSLEFEPSAPKIRSVGGDQDGEVNKIQVQGHISRPVFGEGRQTPDRQMFFVNSRPCGLPQIAKAFNEVYKSFNVSQSPFIFADFHMDTNAYDVNVSPDKRTILLHDAGAMIESLKTSLTELFESADQTVPQSKPSFKQQFLGSSQASVASRKPSVPEPAVADEEGEEEKEEEDAQDEEDDADEGAESTQDSAQKRMKSFLSGLGSSSRGVESSSARSSVLDHRPLDPSPTVTPARPVVREVSSQVHSTQGRTDREESPSELDGTQDQPDTQEEIETAGDEDEPSQSTAIFDEQPTSSQADPSVETPNAIQNAFDRMRPRRMPAEVATITIGNRTVTSTVGSGIPKKRTADGDSDGGFMERKRRIHTPSRPGIFSQFAVPGSQATEVSKDTDEEEEIEDEAEDEAEDKAKDIQDDQPEDGSQSFVPDNESDHAPDDMGEERESPEPDAGGPIEPNTQASAPDNMTEEEKKAHEEAEVQRLIQEAEEKAALPGENTTNRANKMNKGAVHKDSTVHLVGSINGSFSKIQSQMEKLQQSLQSPTAGASKIPDADEATISQQTAEDRLSLTVTKDDFAKMRIIGQFNLGFILATRSSTSKDDTIIGKDELFIIDQHASDEKFNFERLQAETIVQNQRLVQPKTLDLTAVEEEIVLENRAALEKNGFIVDIDDSGNEPIGRRCKLVSLPLSKEVVFGVRDLEELIVLLSETPATGTTTKRDVYIPRPSKVRKMFAMRACRSSIMIGKNLTSRQMERVVRNMGSIDKPWNCPHGRPTMRHLMSLGEWDEYDEWDEFRDDDKDGDQDEMGLWKSYFEEMADVEADEEEDVE